MCTALRGREGDQAGLLAAARELLDRDDHEWRGVYDDRRFDRHVLACARRVARMARANEGFVNRLRHQ